MTLVRYAQAGGAASITLASAGTGNSLTDQLGRELGAAVGQARKDDARVVLLRAEGPMFCVGGDINGFAAAPDRGAFVAEAAEGISLIVSAIQRLDAVVVSVVRGVAAGAGFPLAMAADLVLASESARFVLAYTKIGFTMDGGASLLPTSVGLHRALNLSLLNPTLTGAEAHAMGLVAQVHPDGALDAAAGAVVATLLAGSRTAQVAAKRLLRDQTNSQPEGAMKKESLSMRAAAASPDGVEGVDAFLGKRPARFPSAQ